MEKKNNESKMIKITLLEIKPPLKQLEKNNNEISIIFQGINIFYNIRKLLLNNTEIKINDCKNSIIMSLVKSDTIFASTLFNIKQGENWVTFNYESKKKTSLKQNVNYIDCIKIKMLCQLEEKINIKKNLSNNKNKINSRNIKNNSRIKKFNNTTSMSINNKVSNNSRIKKYRTNINILQRKKTNAFNDNKTQFRYSSIITEDVNKIRSSVDLGQTNRSTTFYKNHSYKLDFKDFSRKTRNDMSNTLSGFKNGEFSCILMNNSRFNTSLSSFMKSNKNNLTSQKNLKSKSKNKNKKKTQINIKNYNILNKCFDINACLRDTLITENKNKNENEKNISDMDSISKRLSFTNSNFFMSNHSPIRSLGTGTNYIHSLYTKQFNYNLPLGESYNNNSANIIKRLIVNRNKQSIKYNKKSIKNNIQGNITNSYSTATTKKNECSLNSIQEDEEKSNNIKNIYKKYTYSLTTKRQKKCNKPSNIKNNKSQSQLSFENNLHMDNIKLNVGNIKDIIYSENRNDFRKEIDGEIKKIEENEEGIGETGGDVVACDDGDDYNIFDEEYFRLKGDFDLLYNDQYVNNIKNDLLKLEIELLFEKMIDMMIVYHMALNKRINENKISKYKYNENRAKFILLNKLNNKLEIAKNKKSNKDSLLYENRSIIRQYNNKNLSLNKDEFNIFNKIINTKKININKNLKEILNIIVNNNKNKDILGNGKLNEGLRKKKIVKINANIKRKNNTNNIGKNIRKKIIPKKQLTKISSKKNINELNSDKLHNNLKGEGIYTKKYPKTPLYNIKTNFNQ